MKGDSSKFPQRRGQVALGGRGHGLGQGRLVRVKKLQLQVAALEQAALPLGEADGEGGDAQGRRGVILREAGD